MDIITENINLYYEHDCDELADQIYNTLLLNLDSILRFFRLKKLKNKVDVIIYSTIEDYIVHINKCKHSYYEWMIADTFDRKINIMSIDACRKTNSHRIMSLEDYSKLIVHEFVHICQQEVNANSYGCEWFWEALATNLSGQYMKPTDVLCTKDELMFNYVNIPNAYAISYNLGQYMLQNLSHDLIYEYISNPTILWNDTEKILISVK